MHSFYFRGFWDSCPHLAVIPRVVVHVGLFDQDDRYLHHWQSECSKEDGGRKMEEGRKMKEGERR
jgi:hypothetical protein